MKNSFITCAVVYICMQKSYASYVKSDLTNNNEIIYELFGVSSLDSSSVEILDDANRVTLSWELDESKTEIMFELWAQTTGYVGFGISPNGGMVGADIIIAGVFPDGTPYFSDRFASANALPNKDSHEDWNLFSARENGSFTYLKFSRPINTCDKQEDYPVSKGTNRVIWALGKTDDLKQHSSENRGTRSVNFMSLSPQPNEDGLKEWISEVDFELNGDETSYWVTIHEWFPFDTDKFVVAYDAYLPNKLAVQHTHHMVLYDCALPPDGSFDETLSNVSVASGYKGFTSLVIDRDSPDYKYCRQALFSWAAGSKMVTFPEHVAYSLKKLHPARKKYFALEVHYNNPERIAGVIVTNGLKVIYSEKPRKFDAGYLLMEYQSATILIPPMQKDFICSGHCCSSCTNDKISPEGISIFSVQLHAHISAKKIKLRHFRNGEELPWIAVDDHYDFNYQQFRQLDEARKVYPGDHLVVECSYDSTWKKGEVVLGGASSQDEMCEALLWYYPRQPNFLLCGSHYNLTKSLLEIGFTEFYLGKDEQDKPHVLLEDYLSFVNKDVDWTPEFINQLQELRRYGDHFVQCASEDRAMLQYDRTVRYPEIIQEYLPQDVCDE